MTGTHPCDSPQLGADPGRWVDIMTFGRPHGSFFLCGALALAMTAGRSAYGDEAPTFADRADETADEAMRSVAFMFNPLAMATGVFGAEADVALTKRLAVAAEGDVYAMGGPGGPAAVVGIGLLFYPLRSVFHGLYVEPRFVFARRLSESPFAIDWSTDVLGLGGTAGWEWTWDYGFSVRVGGGAMDYVGGVESAAPGAAIAVGGDAVLVTDASLGWAF